MTKCIVLGKRPEEKNLKPIEFVLVLLYTEIKFGKAVIKPKQYSNIELISLGSSRGNHDIMFAYDDERNRGSIYLGYWNDGVVE